jgi:hypothetical protein
MAFDAQPSEEIITRDRILRLRDFLEGLPAEKFDMRVWTNGQVHECGTPACIGGWASRLRGEFMDPTRVGKWLGLSVDDARNLFGVTYFEDRTTANFNATTADAVRVLDHYLSTGRIDWSVGQ